MRRKTQQDSVEHRLDQQRHTVSSSDEADSTRTSPRRRAHLKQLAAANIVYLRVETMDTLHPPDAKVRARGNVTDSAALFSQARRTVCLASVYTVRVINRIMTALHPFCYTSPSTHERHLLTCLQGRPERDFGGEAFSTTRHNPIRRQDYKIALKSYLYPHLYEVGATLALAEPF